MHFSDESPICANHRGRVYVRKYSEENWNDPKFRIPIKNFNLNIMVWGLISLEGFESLIWLDKSVDSEYYINRVLKRHVVNKTEY